MKINKIIYLAIVAIFCASCKRSQNSNNENCKKIWIEYRFYSSLDEEFINYLATLTYRFDSVFHYNLIVNDSLLYYKYETQNGFLNFRTNTLETKIASNDIGIPTGNFAGDLFPGFIFDKNYLISFLSDTIDKKIEIKKIGQVSLIQKETAQVDEHSEDLVKFIGSKEYICYNNLSKEIFFEIIVANFELNGVKFFQKEFKKFMHLKDDLCNLDDFKDRILKAEGPDIASNLEAKNDTTLRIPEFKFRDLNDQIIESKTIKEDFVFMEFWYISCGPCLINMKGINNIYSKYNSKNIKFLVLNDADFEIDKIKRIKNNFKLTYDLLYYGDSISEVLGITDHPFTLIYDNRSKKIIHRKVGTNSNYEQEIIHILDSLVSK